MSGLATIVLPFYNLAHMTRACLHSLARCTEYDPLQLILVDNGSQPEEGALVRNELRASYRPLWLLLQLPQNRGWVGGCLAAYQKAPPETEWLVLLNNDTVLSPGWLTRMIGALEAHPEFGVMGCVSAGGAGWQDLERMQDRHWIAAELPVPASPADLEAAALQLAARHGREVREAQMAAFFCAVLRREMIEEIGFLDPRFGLGLGDDDDLCRRARAAGWKVGIALDALVWHWHRSTFQALALEGLDWEVGQEQNRQLLAQKEAAVQMKYLGRDGYPYIMGVPARDLTAADLLELAEQGRKREALLRTGLYAATDELEIRPFCGYPKEDGSPCRRTVPAWGERCWQHREVTDAKEATNVAEEVNDG